MKTIVMLSAVAACVFLIGATNNKVHDQKHVEFINSGKVLPPGLPFSEAVCVGNTLYVSGLIGIESKTMKLVPGGLKAESIQTLEHIKTILKASGYSMRDVVKVNVFLADMKEWGAFNEVYKTYFKGNMPARTAVGTNGLALGARVEVECVAVRHE